MSTHGRQLHFKPHPRNMKGFTSGHASRMQMGSKEEAHGGHDTDMREMLKKA